MNKTLKLLTDKALCALVTRLTLKQVIYKAPLSKDAVRYLRRKIGLT